MKKFLLIISSVLLLVFFVNGQAYNYGYDRSNTNHENKYNSSNRNYEYNYNYRSIIPYINDYDYIHYWKHPYSQTNFVIIGNEIFIFPRHIFYNFYDKYRFRAVTMDRFIALSSFGLSYYDNYYRFNTYSDYYRYYPYRRGYRNVRNYYRKHYKKRKNHRRYIDIRRRYKDRRGFTKKYSRPGYDKRSKGSRYKNSLDKRLITPRGKYGRTDSYNNLNTKKSIYKKKSYPVKKKHSKTKYKKRKKKD